MALMDEAERRRFLETLRQDDTFRADVRRELLMQELLELPQTVALLAASINGLIEHQAEMQRELTTLRGDVDALVITTHRLLEIVGNGFTEMRQGFADIRAEMRSGFAEVDARFEAVDTRFDAVDTRFDAVDAKFEAVDARFDAVDARFEAVDARFDAVDARFDRYEAEFRHNGNPPTP